MPILKDILSKIMHIDEKVAQTFADDDKSVNEKKPAQKTNTISHHYPDIKLTFRRSNSVSDEDEKKIRSIVDHRAKLSTDKKVVEKDKKDSRCINAFKNVKLSLPYGKGSIILFGTLNISYSRDYPMGGNFYCYRVSLVKDKSFDSFGGVDLNITFTNSLESPTPSREMTDFFDILDQDSRFVYNISQFSEFMDIFGYYKEVSAELNNNDNFAVTSISTPYYYISSDNKIDEADILSEVYDDQGILKGYIIGADAYNYLDEELYTKVLHLVDVEIKGNSTTLKKVRRIGNENIYLSNIERVNDKNIELLKQFFVVNSRIEGDHIVLSGELKSDDDYSQHYKFLNLYDMGQKIKIDSIEESLRLIDQGATSGAMELLEYLIGDAPMPSCGGVDSNDPKVAPYLKGLNESQQRAFLMAVDGSPVSLIKGPPGTGKTHVINAIVRYITKVRGEKVIVSSQTHVAIDNVLDKLMENNDLVIPKRITNRRNKYSSQDLDYTLYKTWGRKFQDFNDQLVQDKKLAKSVGDLMQNFKGEQKFSYTNYQSDNDYQVIGATTTTSAIAGRNGYKVLNGYSWLIIDEVSKCPITEVLRYLPYVDHIIMVGDDYQLSPLLEFSKDDVKGLECYDEEKFNRLEATYQDSVFAKVMDKAKEAGRLVLLNENYRSVADILAVYNVFYNGELKGLREETKPRKVYFNDTTYNNHDIFFVDVRGGQETKEGTSRYNVKENEATAYYLRELMATTINPETVSVSAIFPYAAQISHFQKDYRDLINEAKKLFLSFEIDTVDAFQGKESDIILCDTVVTDSSQGNFLNDFRRINVSMSRARDKLFIFGNPITLAKINMKTTDQNSSRYFDRIIKYVSNESPRGLRLIYEGGKQE